MSRHSILLVVVACFAGSVLPASTQGAASQRVKHLIDDHGASFSPDGKTIVFERFYSTLRRGVDTHPIPKRSVLFLMNADGSGKKVLRHARARFEGDASFSPDGRSILFVRNGRIHLMQRNGSGAHPVGADTGQHACPRFSPDGSKISFWRGSARSGGYFTMNADGTSVRRISGGQRFAWGCPAWFPNGKLIVFTKDYNLFVASADGTSVRRITDDRDGTFYRPSVSPNGRLTACDGWHRPTGYGIIVMHPNGTEIKGITTGRSELENDSGPSWSPDGQRIVFSGYRGAFETAGIYVVDRDGSGLRRLSNFRR